MILYLDSSSIAKDYLEEPHSHTVREWIRSASLVATSRVAYPEVLSALTRRWRQGEFNLERLELLHEKLEEEWSSFLLLPVMERYAGDLVLRHPLRGFDAIHLAAALDLKNTPRMEDVVFSSFDARLLSAARAEGLAILHLPEEGLVREEWAEYGAAVSL